MRNKIDILISYSGAPSRMDCIFCSIAQGSIPCKKIAETKDALSFLDAFPLAPGHAIVIPKAHYRLIEEMPGPEAAEMFGLAQKISAKISGSIGAALIAIHNGKGSGQEIPHVHMHLVPRSSGDGAGAIHSMFKAKKFSKEEIDQMYAKLKD